MNRSRVIKNYSSPARDSVPWPKLFDPVGIRIKSSKVDESRKFADLAVETNCRRNKTKSSSPNSKSSLLAFFVYEQGWYKPLGSVEEMGMWFSRGACSGLIPREFLSLFGASVNTDQQQQRCLESSLKSFKTNTVAFQQSVVSLVITLYLWQKDLGLINWWNTSCQCNTNTKSLK